MHTKRVIQVLVIAAALSAVVAQGAAALDLAVYGHLGYTLIGPDGKDLGYTNISTDETWLNDGNSEWNRFQLGGGVQLQKLFEALPLGLDAGLMTVYSMTATMITEIDSPGDKNDFRESSIFLSICPFYQFSLSPGIALQAGPGLYFDLASYHFEFVSVDFPSLNETDSDFDIDVHLGIFTSLTGRITERLFWRVRVDLVLNWGIALPVGLSVGYWL